MVTRFVCSALFIPLLACALFAQSSARFAVIGDYGYDNQAEGDVSTLVKNWNPDFVITMGDNNYDLGAASTIDRNIGKYYHEFISPYTGIYGSGDTANRFFPCLGNHDWEAAGALPYLNYFSLPGNERYYEFTRGPVHFFAIDSDPREPDGTTDSSAQGVWLKNALAQAVEPWKIVYFHHPAYNSGARHGPTPAMRWPFKAWGASLVLSGHEHVYERLVEDGFNYITNGLGGRNIYVFASVIDTGSRFRYNADYGAMFVTASPTHLNLTFVSRSDSLVDTYALEKEPPAGVSPEEPPQGFSLHQNFPNPFNPSTNISFVVDRTSHVSITIYDAAGRKVSELADRLMDPGTYDIPFSGQMLSSGVYYIRFTSAKFSDVKKMLLLR